MTTALSKYNKTLELQSIVDDKFNKIFCSEQVFEKIVNCFLEKLKKEDDKKLAIGYLIDTFPDNNYLIQKKKMLAGSWFNIRNLLSDYGLKENKKISLQWEKLYILTQNKDLERLNELIEDQEFCKICKIPTSLVQQKDVFEKLKHHSFRIIDIIRQCRKSSFQLNSIIMKNLIFFFFIPNELEIGNQEKTRLYQILGEILCNFWIQFEYHYQQLQQQNQNKNNLIKLQEILSLFQKDSFIYYDKIQELIRQLLNKNNSNSLKFTEIENLIDKLLPINFDLQIIFYMMCFYCSINFDQYYKKKLMKDNKENSFKLLNLYIQYRMSTNNKLNGQFMNVLEKYEKRQSTIKQELGKWKIWSLNELIEYIIEENIHNLNLRQHIMNLNSQNLKNAKYLNLLSNISNEKKRKVAHLLQNLIFEDNLIQVVLKLEEQKQNYLTEELEIILRIVIENSNRNIVNFQLLNTVLQQNRSQQEIEDIIKVSEYDQSLPFEQQINLLSNFSNDQFQLIINQAVIANSLIQTYLKDLNSNNIQFFNLSQILEVLRRLFSQNKQLEQYNEFTKLFFQLLNYLLNDQINRLIYGNKSNQISLDDYLTNLSILYQLFSKLQGQNKQQELKMAIQNILQFPQVYCFNNYLELFLDNKTFEQIINVFKLVYYWQTGQIQQLIVHAEQFCKQDANFYKEQFQKINYFNIDQLEITKLQQKLKSNIYPRSLNISLEDFNISLTLLNKQQQEELVKNWIKNVKDPDAFKQLIPFFFNIFKRGEPSTDFLTIINEQITEDKVLMTKYGFFNQKSIFQIFYNNSDDELKVMLLKLMSKQYPIPLLYRTSSNPESGELDKLTFNMNTFYVFEQNYPIINLSLSSNQKRIGKTDLINTIFYKKYKFEISDNNYLNKQTIDIMYDFEFNGSRNLSVADAHGFIPFEILDDILPLFKLWIIQLDTEREIKETIQNLKKLKSFQNKQKVVCFLIRNSIRKLDEQEIAELEFHNIQYKQVINLSNNDLNNEMRKANIAQTSKFLFDIIQKNHYQTLKQEEYFNLICQMANCPQNQIFQIKQTQDLFKDIEIELEKQMKDVDGFYNENAFPIRSIEWQIKKERDAYSKIQQSRQNKQSEDKLNQINQKMIFLQNSMSYQQPSLILIQFCNLLKKPNYYILYLHLVDKIRKFNEKNTYQLQRENQKLNEEISKLDKEKKKLKNQIQKGINQDLQKQINHLQQQIENKILILKQNSETISKRNIGIELFWREIIQQREQCQQSHIDFDPSIIVKEMIQKGEPFEFLDGDSLRIDQPFLKKLISNFKEQGQERILVLSVLGPQSSGKSTILNKIFGCHFWTSVGRCTKGIYLQLLKVHNKAYFNNLFDYIIILDTEGLQSPNQEDLEFDKKIALFVLSISDIIIVNVKGDITREFRSLVEMCIYTLGQMRNFTSSKSITWCFNQNNDVNNHDPFLAQLQSIALNLNSELSNHNQDNEQIDYNEILGITQENIKILGFASTENLWIKNDREGVYYDWRQLILNGTFSQEAYEYGIRMIQAYVNKFGNEDNYYGIKQMENLKYFVGKIETTWSSILSLPDLLEFSELVLHQQNQFMRKQFNEITDNYQFPTKSQFFQQIHETIQEKDQGLYVDIFKQILNQYNQELNNQFDQINSELLVRLTAIKNENKISKKVFIKYKNMLDDRINSEKTAIQFAILQEIKTQETTFQQKMGFIKIDQFILELIGNENELRLYKEDENKIKTKFEELWNEILQQDAQKQNEIFRGHCDGVLSVIKENFKNYILTTNREVSYKHQYMKSLIEQKPQKEDYLTAFEILKPELSMAQFMVVEKNIPNKDYQYFFENFSQNIEKKLAKCSSTQVLQINQFYSYKVEIKYMSKENFNQYQQKDMYYDLQSYCKTTHKIDKFSFINFLRNFSIFGYQIQEQKAEQLFNQIEKQSKYDQKMLLSCFQSGDRQYFGETQYDVSIDIIKKQCTRFKNYIQNKLIISEQSQNNEIENNAKKFNENEFFIVQIKLQVILKQNIGSYNNKQSNEEMVKIFSYILNQNQNSQFYNDFKENVTRFIEQLMSNNNNSGWKKVYSEIHQMILDEIKEMKAKQYSYSLIKRILQKIESKIKDLNMLFSDFGVILNDRGERCIYYYAIFSIWRILCFKQQKLTKKAQQQLVNQYKTQYLKFKADIQQNKKEQSKIRGQQLAEEIINQTIVRFQMKYQGEAKLILDGLKKETSFDIIKQLDKDILERNNNDVTNDQILHYIRNQTDFIEKYVKEKINKLKSDIQTKFTNKLKNDLNSYLQKLDANTKYLSDYVISPLQAKDYFIQLDNPDEAPKLLYKIVLSCLQGLVQQNLLEKIKQDKIYAFQTQDFHIFELPLCSKIQKSDEEIQILLNFVQAFKQKIQKGIQNIEQLQIQLETLKLQDDLDTQQLKQIGCLQCCPLCKRKCDQEIDDSNHKHQCQNGHQLRGMSGVLIGCHPSLYTCEEIEDDFQISLLETSTVKSWKDIKQIYNGWIFNFLNKDELKSQKEKFMKIWNDNIGRMICQKLTQEIQKDVFYVAKQEVVLGGNQKTANYILILDDSGSMEGYPFNSARQCLVEFLHEIQKNPDSRVTIILFNHEARCVVDYQIPNPSVQEPLIYCQGGGTNFEFPLELACDKISQNPEFEKFSSHSIFFYTDGQAYYPQKAMEKFRNLPQEKKEKIELIACSLEESPTILIKVVEFCKQFLSSAKIQTSMEPQRIAQVWIEEVSKVTHQIF
ncbi:unnamed protein product [Paramecium pentaurelia]|uniref:VLIG-type G domain-containing protein n=1 Tax=Paramecium pentaurelia TaxID=43138 RepID=A0A8S1RRL5_9CILI|nr:unnamed protein product [Paramecium pentaurelia]